MATADFTVATPSPTSGAAADLLGASLEQQGQQVRTDRAVNQGFLTSQFQYTAPQLASSIAANGQYFGTARQGAEKNNLQQYLHSSYDIQSAAQRQLDDLTRQRMYAALGLVI